MEVDRFTTSYPNGIHIDFEPEGHTYGIGYSPESLDAVPGASELLDFLPKYLVEWGQGIGVRGSMDLVRRAIVDRDSHGNVLLDTSRYSLEDEQFNVKELRRQGLDHNAIRNDAAARGSTVHAAFRGFIDNGVMPNPADYATGEAKGYIESLRQFCEAIKGNVETILCERPVCSMEFGVAGTPDWLGVVNAANLCTGGEVRKRHAIFSGLTLFDLKTSKQVYLSHTYQLSLYEKMLRECGVIPKQAQKAVVLIKAQGRGYNVKVQKSKAHALPSLVGLYNAEKRPDGWTDPLAPANWRDAA